ncbi:MAG: hypothetical protein ACK42G_07510, partial [Candidatus Kapaibacteriota bacterium]
DQLYLDDWTERFKGVHVMKHLGGGLAAWNVQQYEFKNENEKILGTEISPHELFTIRGGITILGDKDQNLKFFPMTIWGGGVSFKPNFEDFYNLFSVDFSFGNDLLSKNKTYYSIGISLQF